MYIKHAPIDIKHSWNIKNYRYVWDVSVLPAVHFEKPPFPIRIKEHSIVANVVNKSERKAYEPYE